MSAHDELVAQLFRALAETGRARTAVFHAREHAARAADAFESTFGRFHPEMSAPARAGARDAARLAATLDRAAIDLRSHLDRLLAGTDPPPSPGLPAEGR